MLTGPVEVGIDLVALLIAGAAFLYWVVHRAVSVATKKYVEDHVSEELDPLEEKAERAFEDAQRNQDELQYIRDLIEGGNSKFDKGLMDYLDENIKRTGAIRDDLEDIHQEIRRIQLEREEYDRLDWDEDGSDRR